MEVLDALSFFSAGLFFGLIVGHWLGKQDRKLAYDTGRMDALWEIHEREIRRSFDRLLKPCTDPAAGGQNGHHKTV